MWDSKILFKAFDIGVVLENSTLRSLKKAAQDAIKLMKIMKFFIFAEIFIKQTIQFESRIKSEIFSIWIEI